MDTEARINELEARVALQDQSLLELGDEVYRQQRRIGELEDRLRVLAQRLEALTAPPPAAGNPADEVPPHY
ncbi:MAG TPA: SlyX family protein [Gammaproteobacteria bacterium]|nr:SlyX family protein [Gammaproteobacteria bacterium]